MTTQPAPTQYDLERLTDKYVMHIINGLSYSDMEQMLYDLLIEDYEKHSWDEITEEIVDLYGEDTLIDLLPEAQWDLSSPLSYSSLVLTLASTLSTLSQTFKMKELNDSANNSLQVHPTMKCVRTSDNIIRQYSHIQSDSDWDDILSPDDYEEYLERRQYEKMMRR